MLHRLIVLISINRDMKHLAANIAKINAKNMRRFKIRFITFKVKYHWMLYMKRKKNFHYNKIKYLLTFMGNTMLKPNSNMERYYEPLRKFFNLIMYKNKKLELA